MGFSFMGLDFFGTKGLEEHSEGEATNISLSNDIQSSSLEERMVVAKNIPTGEATKREKALKSEIEERQSNEAMSRDKLWEEVEDLMNRVPGKNSQWRSEKIGEFKKGNTVLLNTVKTQLLEKYGFDLAQQPLQTVVYEESDTGADAPVSGSELPGEEGDIPRIDPAQTPSSGAVATPVFAQRPSAISKDEAKSELDTVQENKKNLIDPAQTPSSGDMPTPIFAERDTPESSPVEPVAKVFPTKKPSISLDQRVYEESDTTGDAPISGSEFPGEEGDEPVAKSPVVVEPVEAVVEASTTELLTDTPEDEATATPESSDKVIEHTVVKGQSLWRIVQAYFPDIESSEAINDKIDQIVQDNSIKDKNSLEIGQKLKISGFVPQRTHIAEESQEIFAKYRVDAGDSLWAIAQKHLSGSPSSADIQQLVDKIAEKNNIADKDKISIGQTLEIPM